MKALGLAALLLSLAMIFVPLAGAYGTAASGLVAALAWGRGFTMGMAAILINLVNVLLLSPILYLNKNAGLEKGDSTPLYILIGLALIQIVYGILLLYLERLARRRAQPPPQEKI